MAAQELLQQAEAQWRHLAEPHATSGMLAPHIGHLVSSAELKIAGDACLFATGRRTCLLSLLQALQNASRQAKAGAVPFVLHRHAVFPARPDGLVRSAPWAHPVLVVQPCFSGCFTAPSLTSSSQHLDTAEPWERIALCQKHQAALGLPNPLSMCRQKTLVMSCWTHNSSCRWAHCLPDVWFGPFFMACASLHSPALAGVRHTHRPARLPAACQPEPSEAAVFTTATTTQGPAPAGCSSKSPETGGQVCSM